MWVPPDLSRKAHLGVIAVAGGANLLCQDGAIDRRALRAQAAAICTDGVG